MAIAYVMVPSNASHIRNNRKWIAFAANNFVFDYFPVTPMDEIKCLIEPKGGCDTRHRNGAPWNIGGSVRVLVTRQPNQTFTVKWTLFGRYQIL